MTALLMIVLKKDGSIRTIIDARQWNDNTLSDVNPMPDQEMIRNTFVRAQFRTKIDLSDALMWQIPHKPQKPPKQQQQTETLNEGEGEDVAVIR